MIYKGWHRFVRKRTKPIPEETAVLWKRRLSIAYGVIAWNAFGFMIYSVYKGKSDWADYYGLKTDEEKAERPGQAWAKTLGIKNAKVYRVAGLKQVDEYDIVDGEMITKDKNTTTKNEIQETLSE